MKKRLFASVGLSLLALNVFGSAAYATENTEKPQSEFIQEGLQSDVDIHFIGGNLKLEKVPEISFGELNIASGPLYSSINNGSQEARVMDTRGTKEGWNLGVSLSPLMGENGEELRGAKLFLQNGRVSGDVPDGEKPTLITTPNMMGYSNTIELSPNGEFQDILLAKKGQGAGYTRLNYGLEGSRKKGERNGNIFMYVPRSSAQLQSYKGQMNWVLTNAPT
ncbi:WxL domain-containing protein [Enterococcus sp. DIV1444a]|uniref:WxL domain-containing protein n=1 Tax=Enterococcus sp. DIV1444a TaxID=2774679 RepID=UPI003F217326